MNLFLILIALFVIDFTVKFINKRDKVNITIDRIGWFFLVGIISISTFLLSARYTYRNIDFYYFYILLIYLVITAYIDYKTTDIYSFLNYIMFGISCLFILMNWLKGNPIKPMIVSLILVSLISVIFSLLNAWGWGDTEMLIAISSMVGIKGYIFFDTIPIPVAIFVIVFSTFILGVISIIKILLKRNKVNDRVAFAPYIAISTMLIMIFL